MKLSRGNGTMPTQRNRITHLSAVAALMIVAGAAYWASPSSAETARRLLPPAIDETTGASREVTVLAGGCFWGVQGVFQHVDGVISAVSGYAGGSRDTAQYETTSSGTTGHAESVQITFDPHRITYGHILQIYFSVAHDPTELNRQGPDVGKQYRSAIFPQNPEQSRIATAYIAQLNAAKLFPTRIVTTIVSIRRRPRYGKGQAAAACSARLDWSISIGLTNGRYRRNLVICRSLWRRSVHNPICRRSLSCTVGRRFVEFTSYALASRLSGDPALAKRSPKPYNSA